VFMVLGSIVVAGYAIYQAGGIGEIVNNVPSELTAIPEGFGEAGLMTILLWAFAILPGTVTNQMYFQRIFAAKNVGEGRKGIYIGAIGIILAGFYALIIGLAVRAMHGGLGEDRREEAAGWFLGGLPVWLLAIYGAFLMATIVATTGSALQSVVGKLVYEERLESTNMVTASRWCTVGVTIIATILAIVYPEALGWLVASYAYSASVLAVPLIGGMIMNRRRGQLSVAVSFAAMAAGLVG